jgi:multidrug efflux pump subunit AcrA (membrane-fusion protein)
MGGGMSRFKISRMTDEGKQVSEGDFLLEFDGADIDRNLRDVTANFQKEQQRYQKKRSDFDMQVRQLSYDVDQAKADAEKIANKLQSQVELESALTVEEAKLRLTVARKKAELLEKKLALLKESGRLDLQISLSNERAYKNLMETLLDAKDSLTITAPVPGVVIYKRGWDGEAKQVGSYANGPQDIVIELPDLSTLRAKINVDEVDFNKIKMGQLCDIQVQAVKGRLFKGKISSISAILKLAAFDRAQKIAEVMLSLEGNPGEDVKLLRPGMSAVASIQVGSFPKAIVIPLSSILERDGRSIVQVWNAEKKEFEWRDVLLATNDGLSAVIKQGLQANDKIRIKPKA